ncbi:MAG: hypothetical protein DLM65_11815 [Candidatus Aeolococcus gillhamiae]|uniref:Uncharacterized protein n=1 Tax=Candidatus Aeolococcus gillhamiae TaxID=3127015 RepID=A0A2W5Z0V2_9BACT|nr:MAG: hypothetical protein DLM65_11815 [Candidatus Dormibacter sp. RRmetagenome_bin12]
MTFVGLGLDLGSADVRAAVLDDRLRPVAHAAVPPGTVARPGERFPVADPRFAGFGVAPLGDRYAKFAAPAAGDGRSPLRACWRPVGSWVPEFRKV